MNDDEIENFLEMRPDFNDSVVYIELCWEGIGSNYYWADRIYPPACRRVFAAC